MPIQQVPQLHFSCVSWCTQPPKKQLQSDKSLRQTRLRCSCQDVPRRPRCRLSVLPRLCFCRRGRNNTRLLLSVWVTKAPAATTAHGARWSITPAWAGGGRKGGGRRKHTTYWFSTWLSVKGTFVPHCTVKQSAWCIVEERLSRRGFLRSDNKIQIQTYSLHSNTGELERTLSGNNAAHCVHVNHSCQWNFV